MKKTLYILALLVLPMGFVMGQTSGGAQTKPTDSTKGVAVKLPENVKPVDKTQGVAETKKTAPLPAGVKPMDKSKAPVVNQKGPELPKTAPMPGKKN